LSAPRVPVSETGRPPRLLIVGTNRGGGGIESYLVTLATALVDAGAEVGVAAWPDEPIHRALAEDGRVRLWPVRFQRRNDRAATREVMRIAGEFRPDWMVGMYLREFWPLAFVATVRRIPLVLFEHVERRVHPVMRNLLPPFFERMLLPSDYLRRHVARIGFPARKLGILHNPIDTTRFRPDCPLRAATRAEHGFGDGDVVIGFVGRIEPSKGVHTLAEALRIAMAERPDVRALWVGHGVSADGLRAAIDASPYADRHRWVPWTADVRPSLAAMDVLALPSTGKETFGRVLVEAQACGVPVLGSRLGGIPEAMRDGVTGLLCEPGDAASWAQGIVALAADPGRREEMGRQGLAFVHAEFDSRVVANRFLAALRTGLHALDAPDPA